jgi:Zn ribbon nucleic-acid-binding protein
VIKLICPECQSDDLTETKEDAFDEWFLCGECGHEFTFQDSMWSYGW